MAQAAGVEAALLLAVSQYWVRQGLVVTDVTIGVVEVVPYVHPAAMSGCDQVSLGAIMKRKFIGAARRA